MVEKKRQCSAVCGPRTAASGKQCRIMTAKRDGGGEPACGKHGGRSALEWSR